MTNVAAQLRREIEARRRELRPLVEEAQQLEALLAAWDRDLPGDSTVRPRTVATARRRRGARAPRRSVAERQEAILAVLGRRPGIEPQALAAEVGLSRARLLQLLGPLERSGRVIRAQGGLFAGVTGEQADGGPQSDPDIVQDDN